MLWTMRVVGFLVFGVLALGGCACTDAGCVGSLQVSFTEPSTDLGDQATDTTGEPWFTVDMRLGALMLAYVCNDGVLTRVPDEANFLDGWSSGRCSPSGFTIRFRARRRPWPSPCRDPCGASRSTGSRRHIRRSSTRTASTAAVAAARPPSASDYRRATSREGHASHRPSKILSIRSGFARTSRVTWQCRVGHQDVVHVVEQALPGVYFCDAAPPFADRYPSPS